MNAILKLQNLLGRWFGPASDFILLRDQPSISDAEWRLACEIVDWIQAVIGDRAGYMGRFGLDAEIHFPQAIWQLREGGGLYGGFRALCSKNRHVMNYLRMWTQHFTGYRLLTMEYAEGKSFPDPAEVSPAVDDRYRILAARPDAFVTRYRNVCKSLPSDLHISPPGRFGEIGWMVDGKIVTHDTYAYQERIALMFESGAIDHLKAVASAGRTPRVLEIGGGFGGLAYHLKKIVPQARVVIVDIPESLVFAAIYLSLLRPQERHIYMTEATAERYSTSSAPGCTFVPNFMFDSIVAAGPPFDLAINTLSMSEMERRQIAYYCRGIQKLLGDCGGFFEQNQDNSVIGRLDARRVIVDHFPHQLELHSKIIPHPMQGNAHVWSNRPWQPEAEMSPQALANCA